MGRSLAILGVPGVLDGGGAADTSFSMTVTTTGAQTLTLHDLTVSASTTVDWGDGSSNAYTGSGSRAHNYAGAGTWTAASAEAATAIASIISVSPDTVLQILAVTRTPQYTAGKTVKTNCRCAPGGETRLPEPRPPRLRQ